ncbi:MAG: single-stranded DNA-binding protein [Bacteroidales bacterium]|nr:single-stranded DNA-binding protein [Bacteroidales bacterium]
MSLNKVMLIGNAGKDPDIRHLESGVCRATFTLATSDRIKDKTTGESREQTEWHNIVLWRNLAELAEKYIRKGTSVYVEGSIRYRTYTDKDGATRTISEIVADNLQLLGRRQDNPGGGYQQAPSYGGAQHGGYQQHGQYNSGFQAPASQPVQPAQGAAEVISMGDLSDENDLPF